MSIDYARDPRTALTREKYFTMRPKPLERWLWQQGIPASAERVFWYHWDSGARSGTWCSQVPIRIVGRDCCLDPATVTRAYQLLKRIGLLRREGGGRDPNNPFQQATALTEVRLPRELLVTLNREPSRLPAAKTMAPEQVRAVEYEALQGRVVERLSPAPAADRNQSRGVFARMSAGERTRFAEANRHRRGAMEFDADTRLSPADRGHVLETLDSLARARPATTPVLRPQTAQAPKTAGPRRLGALEVLKLRNALKTLASASGTAPDARLMREVVYAVEEGALTKFPAPLAVNVALKKIREGAWSSPRRMPEDWGLSRALPESCSAAGGI